MKKIKTGFTVAWYVFSAAMVAAKIKKDIRTHRSCKGEHDPCACDKQCLACLVD